MAFIYIFILDLAMIIDRIFWSDLLKHLTHKLSAKQQLSAICVIRETTSFLCLFNQLC